MAQEKNLFSLEDFLSANSAKSLGEFDYLHALFKLADLPIDLVFCFIKLLMPEFKLIDGLVFLGEFFETDTYNRYLLEGKSTSETQLWINLVEITGVFEEIDEKDAIRLANSIVEMWNLKLCSEASQGAGSARLIHDKEEGEVFVTIDQSE
jgi:hypothetical protein